MNLYGHGFWVEPKPHKFSKKSGRLYPFLYRKGHERSLYEHLKKDDTHSDRKLR